MEEGERTIDRLPPPTRERLPSQVSKLMPGSVMGLYSFVTGGGVLYIYPTSEGVEVTHEDEKLGSKRERCASSTLRMLPIPEQGLTVVHAGSSSANVYFDEKVATVNAEEGIRLPTYLVLSGEGTKAEKTMEKGVWYEVDQENFHRLEIRKPVEEGKGDESPLDVFFSEDEAGQLNLKIGGRQIKGFEDGVYVFESDGENWELVKYGNNNGKLTRTTVLSFQSSEGVKGIVKRLFNQEDKFSLFVMVVRGGKLAGIMDVAANRQINISKRSPESFSQEQMRETLTNFEVVGKASKDPEHQKHQIEGDPHSFGGDYYLTWRDCKKASPELLRERGELFVIADFATTSTKPNNLNEFLGEIIDRYYSEDPDLPKDPQQRIKEVVDTVVKAYLNEKKPIPDATFAYTIVAKRVDGGIKVYYGGIGNCQIVFYEGNRIKQSFTPDAPIGGKTTVLSSSNAYLKQRVLEIPPGSKISWGVLVATDGLNNPPQFFPDKLSTKNLPIKPNDDVLVVKIDIGN